MSLQTEVQAAWKSFDRRSKRQVQKSAKYSKDAALRIRCLIIVNLIKVSTPTEVSRRLQCSRSHVYRTIGRFVEQGIIGLADQREDNGETKVGPEIESYLYESAQQTPADFGYARPTWTLELFVEIVFSQFGIRLSKSCISLVLRRIGVCYRRAKPIVLCPWKKTRRTRRLHEIKRLVANAPADEVVLYVDEVDVHLNPVIGPDWCISGHQKTVVTPGKNQKRYLAGALNARTGRVTWVEGQQKTSALFIDQLWTLVQRDYPDAKRIHLILDNYRIHSSKQTNIAVEALAHKIELHFLPPYCPDHNRIERVWKDLHDNVTRNHRCTTMDQLMIEVRRYLRIRDLHEQHAYATLA